MTETVFISGANRGLGLALADRFLKGGFHVFAGARNPSSGLSSLMDKYPEKLTVLPLDVTDMDSVRMAVRRVAEQITGLDMLVNNAAVYLGQKRPILEQTYLTTDYLEKTMDTNVFGPLRMTQQFLPLLEKGYRRLIMNISSEAGSIADCRRDREFVYCMSKAALNMQSKILHNYLSPKGIKVLAVHPGWVRTDMGGPDADISADQAAEGVFKLAVKNWKPSDGIYFDYQGNPLRW
jgi:NAD(P)-dependent dehydrogenase (short-subunit alcohol dehydrogenase family)